MNVTHFGAKNYKDNLAKSIFIQIKDLRFESFDSFDVKIIWKFCLNHEIL